MLKDNWGNCLSFSFRMTKHTAEDILNKISKNLNRSLFVILRRHSKYYSSEPLQTIAKLNVQTFLPYLHP